MSFLSAWLFDVYPGGAGMILWLLDEAGRMHALHDDDFTPCFYVRGPEDELAALTRWPRRRRDVRPRATRRPPRGAARRPAARRPPPAPRRRAQPGPRPARHAPGPRRPGGRGRRTPARLPSPPRPPSAARRAPPARAPPPPFPPPPPHPPNPLPARRRRAGRHDRDPPPVRPAGADRRPRLDRHRH